MSFQIIIKNYLKNLQKEYNDAQSDNQHTVELSFRPILNTLFNELALELNSSNTISVIFEPRNQEKMGRPDWRIHDSSTLGIYGYIEAKGLTTETFDISQHEEQFNRYLSLGHKLIITDGIDFVYSFNEKNKPQIISLIDKSLINQKDWSNIAVDPQFEIMMRQFFTGPNPQYCDEGKLVELVALRTRFLSDEIMRYSSISIDEAMNDMEKNAISLLEELRHLVYHHNDRNMRQDKIFADFVAQVIMFTLLYAHRVVCTENDSSIEKERKIIEYLSKDKVDGQVLRPFLTIFHYLINHQNNDSFLLLWTDECIKFLSFVHMTEQQRQSPDYHKLFELFLSKFDPKSRFDYGAYYTPSELADCIVRMVELISINSFNGLSIYKEGNTLIDPCCGTGSFLERIRKNDIYHEAFTMCGFEILPAPYMLANYRMAILNNEIKGENLKCELLLANTLSDYIVGDEVANMETVEGYELNRVRELSNRPITLVIGNPPSSDSSKTNIGEDFSKIQILMDDFRPPAENRHGRQNIQKQINNPHLQFLRWACEMLERSNNNCILAFIIPSSILEADSYKYARKYIVEHFSSAWIIVIDADMRAGIRSNSMFKTQQGRAILIAVKRFNENETLKEYNFVDISSLSKDDKLNWLNQDSSFSFNIFTRHNINSTNYALRPSLPFNEKKYFSYWPMSGEDDLYAIYKNHCSGIKLAPSSIFTHLKAPMLKRRSKDIIQRRTLASEEWLAQQDKPPQEVEVNAFADLLNALGDNAAIDNILNKNIVNYAFRPFLTVKAFLWQELLKKFSKIGGGGTRRRPEIWLAYSDIMTVGISIAHSPKDQNESLKPFASFCWYYPDNDLCRRGNSFIYLNQYPESKKSKNLISNINDKLYNKLSALININGIDLTTKFVFYNYAILNSQLYLDEFEGALYSVNRSDLRPRIPIVNDANVFHQLAELGKNLAELEKYDYVIKNIARYNYDECKSKVPPDFKLIWNKTVNPFNEEDETIFLTDGQNNISIYCPLDVQRLNISGYDIIKNVWMKFNSFDFTHCYFTPEDMEGFLNLVNKLLEYIEIVGKIDIFMHDIIKEKYTLILPS